MTLSLRPGVPVLSPSRLSELVLGYARLPGLWRPAVRFEPAQRWHARLERTAEYEVWLLTWLPGQGTEIHDHGGAAGAFTVLEGELAERVFAGGPQPPHRRDLPAGRLRAFGPRYVHEVLNTTDEPAISIHAYAPALSEMTYFRQQSDGTLATHRTDPVEG